MVFISYPSYLFIWRHLFLQFFLPLFYFKKIYVNITQTLPLHEKKN